MIKPSDIERLVIANKMARQEIAAERPRRAAVIVCRELNWLAKDNQSFWNGLRGMSQSIADHLESVGRVFENLTDFLDAECSIFDRLGLDSSMTDPVVGAVYAEIGMLERIDLEDLTDSGFDNLHKMVLIAAELVCKHSQNAFHRGLDAVVSRKGARILAGAAITGANGAALIGVPFLAPFAGAAHGNICVGSMTVGVSVMKGDASGLIELFKPKG